ncbi:hypothetical protein ACQ7NA_28060 [Escherichia coli]|uniref:hypothetical protein n=1 Tax=Escherichia coli TaxID=562 RepID=UPI003D645F28
MTRRTQFKGNSRSRRRERLKAKALANGVLAREEAISSEVLHRPTLSRAQIQAKGTHETPERIEDAKPIKFMAQDVIWQQKEYRRNLEWICPYISRHLLSLNPLLACCRRYSRGER